MNVLIALLLVGLGMCIDAGYQYKIRVAECDAYETGYKQAHREIFAQDFTPIQNGQETPSMAAPVAMSPTFEERMRTHGRAVVKLK